MIRFLILKYVSLGVNSVRALLLAALMGPHTYGLLGTLVLVQQTLSYAALGMREGLSVKLALAHGEQDKYLEFCSAALLWSWCVGGVVFATSVMLVSGLGVGDANWIWVGTVAALSITNEMLVNINRDRNQLVKVALLEIAFNAVPLGAALVFMHSIAVSTVLQCLAIGLLISVTSYVLGDNVFAWGSVRRQRIKDLLRVGMPMALVSLATVSVSTVFVFAASAMNLGATIGLVVFGNSLCTIVLFGLNMVAWAMTSSSMRGIYAGSSREHLAVFFRIAVLLAPVLLLSLKLVFQFTMQAYSGSEVYAVYFALLQSYGFLLYTELNFLAVKARSIVVAVGYGVVLGIVVLTAALVPQAGLMFLMLLALLLLFFFSILCVRYCRRLGYIDRNTETQKGFLLFPVAFGVGYGLSGVTLALVLTAVFFFAWLVIHKEDVRSLLARRKPQVAQDG